MMKQPFRKVKEGTFRLGMNMVMMGMFTLPLPLLSADGSQAVNLPLAPATNQPWQTELVLATTSPDLLQSNQPEVRIEIEPKKASQKVKPTAKPKQPTVTTKIPGTQNIAPVTSLSACSSAVSNEEKSQWVNRAAAMYSIPAQLLDAVWQVESGRQFCTATKSFAGATGPMQFMPGTWKKYAYDGNGDGVANINDARDALFAGARLLAANGANIGDYRRALFAYNHANWYVNKVLAIAGI